MAKFDFEEYRQPWETGPHWELKREFLECYQDNFPEDRLLCLAQAYSNIVLLHCSYPAPVMIQIHELSKSLKGCKKFRGDQNSSDNNNAAPQGRKGKRSSDSGDSKKFKFIKFCSGENKLLSGESPSNNTPTVDLKTDDSCQVNKLNVEIDRCPVKTSNIETDICPEVSLNVDYASILQSKDFKTINLLASKVQKFVMVKKKNPVDVIQFSATLLKINNLIEFKFSNNTMENSDVKIKKFICEFFVGSTRLSAAEGNSVEIAKKKAAEQALQILMNIENVPTKNLESLQNTNSNLNSKLSGSDLSFLLKFAKSLKTKTNRAGLSKINETVHQMKISDFLVFHVSENLSSSKERNCNYFCDFSIKNISISQGVGSSKKRAKQAAADSGVKYLLNLLETTNDSTLNLQSVENTTVDSALNLQNVENTTVDKMIDMKNEKLNISKLKHEKINPRSPICVNNTINSESFAEKSISTEDCPTNSNSTELPFDQEKKSDHLTQSLHEESKVKSRPFTINKRLLNNSFRRQLALFDRSQIDGTPQSYASMIGQSFQQCRKNLTYDLNQISDMEFKANLLLDKEIIASGTGATSKLAKIDAAKSAVEILRKNVYTIKVKSDLEESLVISRIQMTNFDTENSRVISEGNVGHKMLKMMGWSGGGIGKSEGRAEPVMISDITPGTGLGFKDHQQVGGNMTRKMFSQKIETLLKEFSQSNLMNVLIFSPDFLKSEREMIHKIATKFNLCHTSYGKGERQLCVRRKHSITELLDYILQSGGSTDKYELVDMST